MNLMVKEIGSEFWIDYTPETSRDNKMNWLKKFGKYNLLSSGRGAISLMLEEVNPCSETVLLPSYICESVIIPFIEKGYECFFYDLNLDMTPNIESIMKFDQVGMFVHMGYFGFQTNCNLLYIINHLKCKSTIIVEDVTHSMFSKYERFDENDFYIGSIRKWLGIISGGFLASEKVFIDEVNNLNTEFIQLRENSLFLKREYIKHENMELKKIFLDQFDEAEEELDENPEAYKIDEISLDILKSFNEDELINKRRKNYKCLLDGLKQKEYIEIPFKILSSEICPLFFPIIIKNNRDYIRKKLIAERIYCPIHWPIPPQIDISKHLLTEEIYDNILSIPCDQRYDIDDMSRIIEVINKYENINETKERT